MKFKKEIKIGVVVTFIIFLFLWGYNFLKGRNLFSSYNYYYAVFPHVGDLQTSGAVKVNGFVVGLVSDIAFTSDRLDSLKVEIAVKKNLNISKNTIVRIESGLISGNYVALLPGKGELAQNGDMLKGVLVPDLLGKLAPIADKADSVMNSINYTLGIFHNMLDSTVQDNFRSIVANTERMVSSSRNKIGLILSNFESVSSNLEKSNEDISQLISNLSAFSSTLSESDVKTTVDHANSTLRQLDTLLKGINAGEGTVGKLARNDSAYIFLQRSLEDLDKLLIDLRENPKEYVHFSLFGKKSKN
ncbi:MAG: MlaD family protein [Bacteroidales bacterium]|nr:MlaD family protein [Bacteroidales bacterium]